MLRLRRRVSSPSNRRKAARVPALAGASSSVNSVNQPQIVHFSGHHSTASNICRDLVITSSLRHDSMNSSMVMTPSWFRSSFRKTRSICSRALRSSSTWWARRPISSCTATTISDSSPRLMQPSPFTSYSLKVHRRRSYTEPRSNVDNVISRSCDQNMS